jgi:hypothetical protein
MRVGLLNKIMRLFIVELILIAGVTNLLAQAIPDSADKVNPLLVGAQAPDVILKKTDGSNFDLRKSVAAKPLILIFYRGGW